VDLNLDLRPLDLDLDLDLKISESVDLNLDSDLEKEDLDLPLWDLTISLVRWQGKISETSVCLSRLQKSRRRCQVIWQTIPCLSSSNLEL